MSRADWLHAVEATLSRGREPDPTSFAERFAKSLVSRTEDGIEWQPLYTADDAHADPGFPGFAPYVRGSRPAGAAPDGWEARQRVWAGVDRSNAEYELANGATGVLLDLGAGEGSGRAVGAAPDARSEAPTMDDLADLLDGVYLDLAPVSLEAGPRWEPAARALLDLWDSKSIKPADRRGALGVDPVGDHARSGGRDDLDDRVRAVVALAVEASERAPAAQAIVVDGAVFHEAGATEAQEIGWATAVGAGYLRALIAGGLSVERALGTLEFRFAATADQFGTIAKLRAARRMWARVAEVTGAGAGTGGQRQHAVTARTMLTTYDPWVNILRSTVACFAAGLGGADAVTVQPHDLLQTVGGSRLGRRIARNTQSILRMESSLGRVVDPGGGSWFVERFTDDLARTAWTHAQEVDRAGGIGGALSSGLIAGHLDAVLAERRRRVARRQRPITGVSEFPNVGEPVPPAPPADPEPPVGGRFRPLARYRLAEDFETQRSRADAWVATGDGRPLVFLATLGTPAVHTARATFAKNFFEVGGIRTVADERAQDVPSLAHAFRASGATVACLCSSDAIYAEEGAAAVTALRDAGGETIFVAGPAREVVGADEEIRLGTDVLDVITNTLDLMGVPR